MKQHLNKCDILFDIDFMVIIPPIWKPLENVFFSKSFPSEVDSKGNDLEKNTFSSGFHIGGMITMKLNSVAGLRAEILYSQRGTDYKYQGESYFRLFTESGAVASSRGTRYTTLRVTNTYVDLPLSAYLRLGRIELSAGGYGSFMLTTYRDWETDRKSVV